MGAGSSVSKYLTADSPSTTEDGRPRNPDIEKLLKGREAWRRGRGDFYSWLDQTIEDAIEPELEIVDPHHHAWDMRELNGYNLFSLFKQQYYMTDELIEDFVLGGHRVTHSVYLEAHSFVSKDADPLMAPLGEVEMAQGIAAQFASGKYGNTRAAAAIMGTADLEKYGAAVEPLLIACKTASQNYRGIRCSAQHDPNLKEKFQVSEPSKYAKPKFREGFSLLEKHGLIFDAFVFSTQLSDIRELALAFPGTTIVMDHQGAPIAALGDYEPAPAYNGKQSEIVAKWKEEMDRIAKDCPNVYVKVGGFMPQLGHGFDKREKPITSEELSTFVGEMCLWTIQTFGASRCMFESNFPVDKVNVSYTVLWNAYKRMTKDAGISDEDRRLLFSGTAKRVYRIGEASDAVSSKS